VTPGSDPPVTHQHIDPSIAVLPGTDVGDAWDRFEVFEALHHTLRICNPMTSQELDEVIDAAELADDLRVIDFACGYGEALIRAAEQHAVQGTGIDLSPWMVVAAHRYAQQRAPNADLTWVLGDARDFRVAPAPDVAICIGAEWVWHDFSGTCRALSATLPVGGVAVIGAARLHHAADPDKVRAERGTVDTVDDMAEQLARHHLTPLHRVDPDDAGWDAYLRQTAKAAAAWAQRHPGPRADEWIGEQADWHAARERDREIIGWSVWVAVKDVG